MISLVTSDLEFTLVKRIPSTNEVPLISPWNNLHSGLKNPFWTYLLGTSSVDYDATTYTKIINDVASSNYGPTDGSAFYSMAVDGVIAPEYDLFLHEIYRYLNSAYPDHPNWEELLTSLEITEQLSAAAAIIGYNPDYKFLESWASSATGSPLTREVLKWKIRDLKTLALRRKFSGAYLGYKMIFSSIQRHGSVYLSGTYAPHTEAGLIDTTSPHAFRYFRLIDFEGEKDADYRVQTETSFTGIIDASDATKIFDVNDYYEVDITHSPYYNLEQKAFLRDSSNNSAYIYDPGTVTPSISIEDLKSLTPSNGNSALKCAYVTTTNVLSSATARAYNLIRASVDIDDISLVPRPSSVGEFSLNSTPTILDFYPSTLQDPTVLIDALNTLVPWGGAKEVHVNDVIEDVYLDADGVLTKDTATISQLYRGKIKLFPNSRDSLKYFTLSNYPITIFRIDVTGSSETPQYVDFQGVAKYETIEGLTALTLSMVSILDPAVVVPGDSDINTGRVDLFTDAVFSKYKIHYGQKIDIYQYVSFSGEGNEAWTKVIPFAGWISEFIFGSVLTQESSRYITETPGPLSETFDPPIDFTNESFARFKARTARTFIADHTYYEPVDFYGSVIESSPTNITFLSDINSNISVDDLGVGQSIRGPGIPLGTVISSINEDIVTISSPSLVYGTFAYSSSIKKGRTDNTFILSFKTELQTRYQTNPSSMFSFLWPSTEVWPNVSSGYLEGFNEINLFHYPTNATLAPVNPITTNPHVPGIPRTLSDIVFTKNILLELSLDRCLFHTNVLGSKVCLCDLPWLDYIESQATQIQRSSEKVSIGAQLNLTTDTSGFYSQGSYGYTDPNTRVKFTTFPSLYYGDPPVNTVDPDPEKYVPTYIQVGKGGEGKQSVFKSAADLIRPLVYGEVTQYDEIRTPLTFVDFYAQVEEGDPSTLVFLTQLAYGATGGMAPINIGVSPDDLAVDSPIHGDGIPTGTTVTLIDGYNITISQPATKFGVIVYTATSMQDIPTAITENPIAADEAYLFPGEKRRNTYATTQYLLPLQETANAKTIEGLETPLFESPIGEWENPHNVASPDFETNNFQIINTSIYPQAYQDITLTDAELVVNSPAMLKTFRLPDRSNTLNINDWKYCGEWAPRGTLANPSIPDYPSLDGHVNKDYFIIATTVKIGVVIYYADDWIYYDEGDWKVKRWLFQGLWDDATTLPTAADFDVNDATPTFNEILGQGYPYFIISGTADRTLTGPGGSSADVKLGDWLILLDDFIEGQGFWQVSPCEAYVNLSADIIRSRRLKNWIFQTVWPNLDTPEANEIDFSGYATLSEMMLSKLPYFILTGGPSPWTVTINGIPTSVSNGDYLILKKYDGAILTWEHANGNSTSTSDIVLPGESAIWKYQTTWSSTTDMPELADFPGYGVSVDVGDIDTWLLSGYPYFVVTGATRTLTDSRGKTYNVEHGTWLALTSRSGTILSWKISTADKIFPLPATHLYKTISSIVFSELTNIKIADIEDASSTYALPRKFLTKGSGSFVYKIDPRLTTIPLGGGSPVDLTGSPFYVDSDKKLLYVLNGEQRDYLDLHEPVYFKNVEEVIGVINSTSLNTVSAFEDFSFPSTVSMTDEIIKFSEVNLRNVYAESNETQFFSHYLVTEGVLDGGDASIIRPVSSSDPVINEAYISAFITSLQNTEIGDTITKVHPSTYRTFEANQENKYFKNLLLIAGTINSASELVVRPGTSAESIQSFTDALTRLTTGDRIDSYYLLSGIQSSVGEVVLPGGSYINTIQYNRIGDVSTWLAGGTNGKLYRKVADTAWADCAPAGWGGSAAVLTAKAANLIWFIGGESGKVYKSIDDTDSWISVTLPSWGTDKIHAFASSGTEWIAGGANGKLAYSVDEVNQFNSWLAATLPQPDLGSPGPGGEIDEGWGTGTVRCAGYGNGVWMVGGGDDSNLLARATDPSGTWTLIPLPANWDASENVTSIDYGNNTWVATGTNGNVAYSVNGGITWIMSTMPTLEWSTTDVLMVKYLSGSWVIGGASGKLAKSTDGITWTMLPVQATIGSAAISSMAYGDSVYRLAGATNEVAVFTNTADTIVAATILDVSSTSFTLSETLTGSTWALGETSKEILLAINTSKSIDNELLGVPLSSIEKYTDPITQNMYLSTFTTSATYQTANRIFYPRSDSVLALGANQGYPLYSEDSTMYWDYEFKNNAAESIYLCDTDGNYLNSTLDGRLYPKDFVSIQEYTTDGATFIGATRVDDRQLSWAPKYTTYHAWLQNAAQITPDTNTNLLATSETVTGFSLDSSDPYLQISATIGGSPSAVQVIMRSAAGFTTSSYSFTPTDVDEAYAGFDVTAGTKNTTTINYASYTLDCYSLTETKVSSMYFPPEGYGSLIDHSTNLTDPAKLPWVVSPGDFETDIYLLNGYGELIYLSDATGVYLLDVNDARIPVVAPKYLTYQGLLDYVGNVTEIGVTRTYIPRTLYFSGTVSAGTPTVVTFNLTDSTVLASQFTAGAKILSEGLPEGTYIVTADSTTITLSAPHTIFGKSVEFALVGRAKVQTREDTSFINSDKELLAASMFSATTRRFVKLDMLTKIPVAATAVLNDSTRIMVLTSGDLETFDPDRIYHSTGYSSFATDPSLYTDSLFMTTSGTYIYDCDVSGNYLDANGSITTSDFQTTQQPKYLTCYDWYLDTAHVESEPTNPYWQYVILKDVVDPVNKTWSSSANVYYKKKVLDTLRFVPLSYYPSYVDFAPTLMYKITSEALSIQKAEYIQHLAGFIGGMITANEAYNKVAHPTADDLYLRKFGVFAVSDFATRLTNIYSDTIIVRTPTMFDYTLNTTYTVNSLKNFADPFDRQSSIVGITELGLFNIYNDMIAYATFPPIIYDSARHHVSFNIFIKHGSFG